MITILKKLFMKNEDQMSGSEIRNSYGTMSSILGIFLNILLFGGKYLAGVLSGSIAIMADAFNNLSDAGSSIITLIGFKFAGKKPDPDHPYGHGRIEYISGLGVSVIIILMGFELARSSVQKIMHPEPVDTSVLAVGILIVSILVKFYMAYYNRTIGNRIQSAAMKATAVDSMSDTISTFVVLVGMIILKITDLNVDGWFGLLVAVFVLLAGFGAAKDTMKPLLGQPPERALIDRIEEIVTSYEPVVGIHDLIVHDYGPGRLMISLHAEVPGDGDIYELHDMIDCAENRLNDELGCEAVIHMDPVAVNDQHIVELKVRVMQIVAELDPALSIHDFRMVEGPTHVNLIFDVLTPVTYPMKDEELREELQRRITQWKENYFIVIKVDKSYVQ